MGSVAVALTALKGSASTALLQGDFTLPGVTYSPAMRLNVRLQVTGSNPTTLRLKAWPVGTTEPTAWQRTGTDTTAALQTAGAVGFTSYLSSSSSTSPVVVRIDDLAAQARCRSVAAHLGLWSSPEQGDVQIAHRLAGGRGPQVSASTGLAPGQPHAYQDRLPAELRPWRTICLRLTTKS